MKTRSALVVLAIAAILGVFCPRISLSDPNTTWGVWQNDAECLDSNNAANCPAFDLEWEELGLYGDSDYYCSPGGDGKECSGPSGRTRIPKCRQARPTNPLIECGNKVHATTSELFVDQNGDPVPCSETKDVCETAS